MTDTIYRLNQLSRMHSVLNNANHVLVLSAHAYEAWTHKRWPGAAISTVIHRSVLHSAKKRWTSKKHEKSLPYEFLFHCVMQNAYFSPILIPTLYCFYTAPWEIIHNAEFSKCLLSGTLGVLWGHQDLIVSLSPSGGQCYGGKRHAIVRDIATASAELHFWDV